MEAVELVDGLGNCRYFHASDPKIGKDLFSSIRLALGTFGVLTRIWLRVQPDGNIAQKKLDFAD
jgi:hypothetical protein